MSKDKSGNWFGRHKVFTIVGGIILLVIIGTAMSNGSSPTVTNKASTSTSNATQTSNKTTSQAHVGSTIDIGGSKGLAITVQQVIDPASGADQYTTPDAGKRFVAVKLGIQNNGSGSYQDDANNNVTLIGSDNQSYTADFSNVSGCTNFSSGQYTLGAGENATGCVVFQLPNGTQATKVQFQTIKGFNSSTGEWLIP